MNQEAINKRIQALESELAGLKAEFNKLEKFEFDYSNSKSFRIYAEQIDKNSDVSKTGKENFRYRQTESNAKADLQLQKELMCIGALAEQIDPDYKAKVQWGGAHNGYIYWSESSNKLSTGVTTTRLLGVVYTPKDVAEKVCEILNNKQVEL